MFTLRTMADATALRAALADGSPRVLVVGACFIGAEVAATCHQLGLHATIVEAAETPLVQALGPELAQGCASLHRENGVRLLTGRPVKHLIAGDGRVRGVELADGSRLAADVVVVGPLLQPHPRRAHQDRTLDHRDGATARRDGEPARRADRPAIEGCAVLLVRTVPNSTVCASNSPDIACRMRFPGSSTVTSPTASVSPQCPSVLRGP